jgi:hypothetical protein
MDLGECPDLFAICALTNERPAYLQLLVVAIIMTMCGNTTIRTRWVRCGLLRINGIVL